MKDRYTNTHTLRQTDKEKRARKKNIQTKLQRLKMTTNANRYQDKQRQGKLKDTQPDRGTHDAAAQIMTGKSAEHRRIIKTNPQVTMTPVVLIVTSEPIIVTPLINVLPKP